MNEHDALAALLERAGVDAVLIDRLSAYGARLLATSRLFNLTGAATPEELAPHILDSLTLAPYLAGPVADVGSGGGLPAVPIAIATGVPVTLIESTTKKAAFLEGVLAEFRLAGRVVPQRAELAGRDPALREQFACATARAVSTAPTVLELVVPFLRIGGAAALQRGRTDDRERNALIDAALMLGAAIEQEIALAGDRRIFLVRKIASTPQRFPRRTGVPEKRPLCT